MLLISLLHESDANGVWGAALVEFYVLDDLLVCCLEHVLGESVMTPVRIIGVRHAFDLAQLADRLGVRIPSDCHRRRVVRHLGVLLERLGLIVRNIVKRSHVELAVIMHKLICHPVYRLNQIQGLIFGQRVSLQSILVVLTRILRHLIAVVLVPMTILIIFLPCSWLMVEYSLTIVGIIVVGVRVCSFATSVQIVGMSRLIQQCVVAELTFFPALRGLVNGEHSFVRLAN